MKKIICLAIILFAMVAFANAMSLAIEPKIGLNLADEIYSPQIEPTGVSHPMKAGLIAGAGLDMNFGGPGLEIDALYSQEGYKETDTGWAASYVTAGSTTVKLNYLEIPVILKYNIDLGLGTGFIGIGPEIAFLLSQDINNSVTTPMGIQTSDNTHLFTKKVDYSVVFSLGLSVSSFVIDARYNLSVNNINYIGNLDEPNPPYTQNFVPTRVLNSVISVMIGYKFGL